jgi:hypothetical protein
MWHAHTAKGYPKDRVLRKVFDLPLPKAVMVLSIDTLIPPLEVASEEQLDKFQKALQGNSQQGENFKKILHHASRDTNPDKVLSHKETKFPRIKSKLSLEELTLPGKSCINSPACSVGQRQPLMVDLENPQEVAEAYTLSWESLPKPSVEYLIAMDHVDWIPVSLIGQYMDLNNAGIEQCGNIGFLQKEEYKARTVANPNKVSQALCYPLFSLWRKLDEGLPCSTTFNKEEGVRWVQEQLSNGITLSCVDMTSATDLLDMDMCIDIVNYTYLQHLIGNYDYEQAVEHFRALARGKYWCEDLASFVVWKQGQPLGATPSFMLLDLTNHTLAMWACRLANIPQTSFRCHGDDMVIDQRAERFYIDLIKLFGGEVNVSKTLTSSIMAEFDGMFITATESCNKRFYLSYFDDDSFMSYARYYGPLARKYMMPRQRRVYDQLKFVPGVVVGDSFPHDSFGYPLSARVEWWETVQSQTVPDRDEDRTVGENLLNLLLASDLHMRDESLPWPLFESDYQSLENTGKKFRGDPRKWHLNGKTLLEGLEAIIKSDSFVPFEEFYKETRPSG